MTREAVIAIPCRRSVEISRVLRIRSNALEDAGEGGKHGLVFRRVLADCLQGLSILCRADCESRRKRARKCKFREGASAWIREATFTPSPSTFPSAKTRSPT